MERPIVDLGFNTPNTQQDSVWDKPWVSIRWMRHKKDGPRNKELSDQEAKQRASDMAQCVMSFATKLRNLSSHVHTQEPQKRRLQKLKLSY